MMAPAEAQRADAGTARIGIDCVTDRTDVAVDSVYAERTGAMSGPVHVLVEEGTVCSLTGLGPLSWMRRGTAWESTVSGMEYTAN